MICRNCQSKMTLLLTSYVCDVCTPPEGVIAQQIEQKPKYEKMWIYYDKDPRDVQEMSRLGVVYPRRTEDEAIVVTQKRHPRIYYSNNSRLYSVYYLGPEIKSYTSAFIVKDAKEALKQRLGGWNTVWHRE